MEHPVGDCGLSRRELSMLVTVIHRLIVELKQTRGGFWGTQWVLAMGVTHTCSYLKGLAVNLSEVKIHYFVNHEFCELYFFLNFKPYICSKNCRKYWFYFNDQLLGNS